MATNIFLATIYGKDSAGGNTNFASTTGVINGFSPIGIHVYPTTEVRGVVQAQCNSVIEILPSGLNQQSIKYYTDSTVAQVQTLANA